MKESQFKDLAVCGVPYRMYIAEGGVFFSNKSGFSGFVARYMFSFRSHLWYFEHANSSVDYVPACHLARMHELLCELIWPDHSADGVLRFRISHEMNGEVSQQ